MKKSFDWIIQKKETGKFVRMNNPSCFTTKMALADKYGSRNNARKDVLSTEQVLKVSLDCGGRPMAIIGEG